MGYPDRVRANAEEAFRARYGTGPGRPVCVLIAALNEVECVADVIAAIPPEVAGLASECIVIDDGSTDGTADAATAAGAMVCRFEENLGQGLAFRTGYRLASDRRARVVATLDADGQLDPSELHRVVTPVVEDRADLVVGSRRLGQSKSPDRFRGSGVLVYGALVSLLTRTRITDPSNGLRAFRPEVTDQVSLRQSQYQTSELLIGALSLGFRIMEVPATIRPRAAGESKKGTNLRYGYRFGKVILATWWNYRRSGKGRSQPDR
jgi:glycosyltransferase involved in cell wall biosynthesis